MIIKKAKDTFTMSDVSNKNERVNDVSDYVEETIGAGGRWQLGISTIAISSRYTAIINMTSMVFLTPITDFACADFKDNATMEAVNGTCYENCSRYVYHSDVMETTLISDFGLICDKAWLVTFMQTLLMFGLLLGANFFGWVSDRFGRRIALISATLLNVLSMIPTSFSPDIWTFTVLRFISGTASGGTIMICLPIIMEIVGKKYREAAATYYLIPDGIAVASLALFAYYFPKWNSYILGYTVVCIFILITLLFIPESPRWLISNGKIDRAVAGLTRAAKFNNLPTDHIRDTVVKHVEAMEIKENEAVTATFLDFFKTKSLSIITVTTLYIWCIVGIIYYGIYLYTTLLGLDVVTTVGILGLTQIPLCPLGVLINKFFSRKLSIFCIFSVTGITVLILIFTPKGHWTSSLFVVIGFSASSLSFVVLYIFIAELYPTPLRTMAYGMSSAACKIGVMVAPFIVTITPVWVPSVIFAVLSFSAAVSVYALPEVKGRNLKDTVD